MQRFTVLAALLAIGAAAAGASEPEKKKPVQTVQVGDKKKPLVRSFCDVLKNAADSIRIRPDIRQLQINRQASFRVYIVNSLPRDVYGTQLVVNSEQFTAEVKPSPNWKSFPTLESCVEGYPRVWFDVTLTRKPDVADGKYDIGFGLSVAQVPKKYFQPDGKPVERKRIRSKTVAPQSLADSAEIVSLPQAEGIVVDGKAGEEEWKKAFLCTGFVSHKIRNSFSVRKYPDTQHPSRFRVCADKEAVYCMLNLGGGKGAVSDAASVYLAGSIESKPVKITVDRLTGKVSCEKGLEGVQVKPSADKTVFECRIPRSFIGIGEKDPVYANFSRAVKAKRRDQMFDYAFFWRGSHYIAEDVAVYPLFTQ
ncbi:MAG: hypothetical protein ACYTGB_11390 [Planctomycetota bacterium]|jgi:hypothetical protein